jgi:hypothetical protein
LQYRAIPPVPLAAGLPLYIPLNTFTRGGFRALMPREERFFELFIRHAQVTVAGAVALPATFRGFISSSGMIASRSAPAASVAGLHRLVQPRDALPVPEVRKAAWDRFKGFWKD